MAKNVVVRLAQRTNKFNAWERRYSPSFQSKGPVVKHSFENLEVCAFFICPEASGNGLEEQDPSSQGEDEPGSEGAVGESSSQSEDDEDVVYGTR
jgi:hypothetical protein